MTNEQKEAMKEEAKHKLGMFGSLNALAQHFSLGNRVISGNGRTTEAGDLPIHPLGNTVQVDNSQKPVSASWLPTAALSLIALGGAGAGVASMMGLVPKESAETKSPPVVKPEPSKNKPTDIPIQIDWEFEADAGNNRDK